MVASAISIAVLAHNEERRIARCLESLPLGRADADIHVVVNGSGDDTAAKARQVAAHAGNVTVHEWPEGGKARSWNRIVFDTLESFSPVQVFVDGDAVVAPGSIDALVQALADDSFANAASAMPLNGRKAAHYRQSMRDTHGLFGDLYAVRGGFLDRMKQGGIRLPEDLVGDDGLIAAMVKCDLRNESHWDDRRVTVCEGAGFLCEPVSAVSPAALALQYRRMRSYSLRHFQNRIISEIMKGPGAAALPRRLGALYPLHVPHFRPRRQFPEWWFDRLALARMARLS